MKNTDVSALDTAQLRTVIEECRREAAKRIVGQSHVIDSMLTALTAGGHILLEGVPGLAKTLAVKTFADIAGLDFKRIQFTPDLLPSDITGTLIYEQSAGSFSVRKGPVFTNIVLADEINRSPAKVQSALLEAMAEHQVTIGEKTHKLPEPFFVLATQNPIEQEGTYSLPEAELDRFLLKEIITYPELRDEKEIIKGGGSYADIPVRKILTPEILSSLRRAAEAVVCSDALIEYIVSITAATRPDKKNTVKNSLQGSFKQREDFLKYISFGASPRAGIALCRCAKITALFEGRDFVIPDDIKKNACAVMRHRLVLSYEAAADGVSADDVIAKILSLIPAP